MKDTVNIHGNKGDCNDSAFAEDIIKCLDSGMNAHIEKTVEINMVKW
ncbi:MAG: hypothetical protein HFH66_17175 [Lachnospiraceae bacterium]|nr:hypothetical protein [Lachnospiraceae bacterium]